MERDALSHIKSPQLSDARGQQATTMVEVLMGIGLLGIMAVAKGSAKVRALTVPWD